jgi:hypothetical protein
VQSTPAQPVHERQLPVVEVCAVLRKYPLASVVGDCVVARLTHTRVVRWKKVRNLTVVTDHRVLRNNPNTLWNQTHKRKELNVSARRVRMMQVHRSLRELENWKIVSQLRVRHMEKLHYANVAAFKRRWLSQGRQWEWCMEELVQPSYDKLQKSLLAVATCQGKYEDAVEEYQALRRSLRPPKVRRRHRRKKKSSSAKKNPVPR